MNMLRLSIRQTAAAIGMQSVPGELQIESPHGELTIRQQPAAVEMKTSPGQLQVNADAAWAAYGRQPYLQWRNFIYSQFPGIFLQALAKMVEDGNRMADIAGGRNAVADLAEEALHNGFPPIQYTGPASNDNVKITITKTKLSIHVQPNRPQIDYQVHKPDIRFQRGDVEIYMRQKNSITFKTVPYDLYA